MLRHSLGVLAWQLLSKGEFARALTLADKSAQSGSSFGHFVLYFCFQRTNSHRSLQHLELACTQPDIQLGCTCFLYVSHFASHSTKRMLCWFDAALVILLVKD
jgi:hypothetical protein